MAVTRTDTEAVVNFDHVPISAMHADPDNYARRGRMNNGSPRSGEVDPWMKGVMSREGIDTGAKATSPLEFATADRHGKGDVTHCSEQFVHLGQDGGSFEVGV